MEISRESASIFGWLLSSMSLVSGLAVGQEVIRDPRLEISGPQGQTVVVVERYYDQGNVSKTVTSRIDINEASVPLKLEIGHSGVRIFVVVPTQRPVVLQLVDGQVVLEQTESSEPEILQISLGKIVDTDRFQPPRVFLDGRERTLVADFFAALAKSSTEAIVSPLAAANIEWQTLDALCTTLNAELGERIPPQPDLDGWLSWDGNLGARVISGRAQFQHGNCRFTLMEIDGKLIDVLVETSDIPSDWFAGPSSNEKYVAQSEDLTRRLFAGDVAGAHALFSRQYDEQVTLEVLEDLHAGMRKQFGMEIANIQLKQTTLGDYDADLESRVLSVLHSVTLQSGKQLLSKVDFVFPCGPHVVSRGNLASFNIWESWRTSGPEQVQATQAALDSLFSGTATGFAERVHPELRPYLNEIALSALSEQVRDEWGEIREEPDWDLWKVEAVANNLTASGQFKAREGIVHASVNFSESDLIGVTLEGPRFAISTLDLAVGVAPAAEHGHDFWKNLLSSDLPPAYALLAPVLREQLSFEQFEALIAGSDIGQLPALASLELDTIRFASRLDRKVPVAFAAFYIARFADGTHQPVRCEFRKAVEQDREFELLNFNTDFEITFPVDAQATSDRVLSAFLSGQSQTVIGLVREDERDKIDPHILTAFLHKLQELAEGTAIPNRSRLQHVYRVGSRQEHLATILQTPAGPIPFEATLQYGYLQSFHFTLSALANFASEIENAEGLERVGEEFIRQWLTEGQTEQAQTLMVPELRRPGVVEQLKRLRDQLLAENGTFLALEPTDWSANASENRVTSRFDVDFSRATIPVEIVFHVDAIGGRVLEVRPLPSK